MISSRKIWAFVLLAALGLHSVSVRAQNMSETDSLLGVLKTLTAAEDSVCFEILKKLAFNHPDPIKSLAYAQDALLLARDLKDSVRVARALEELCLSHRTLGNKIQSFKAAFRALTLYDSLGMKKHQATLYVQLGSNYTLEKEYSQAIDFLHEGRKIFVTLKNAYQTTITDINIGETYRLMGRLDSAAWYFENALRTNETLHDVQIRGYAMGNLGMVYARQGHYPEAQQALNEAITILNDLGDVYSASVYIGELGMVFQRQGNTRRGLELLHQSLALAEKNKLKEQIKDVSHLLYTVYAEQKDFEKALHFHQLSKHYEDSLVNLENVKAVEQLKARYEGEKKDKEIVLQQAAIKKNLYERNTLLIVAGFLLIIIVLSVVAYQRKQRDNKLLAYQKDELAEREKQKNWLLGELQHRTKNNLQMISSLLSLQSRQLVGHPSYDALREGQSRVDALAAIHQRLYQEGSQLKITLRDYLIELLENLIYGFNKTVTLEAEIDTVEIDVDKAVPLALMVNELATNALKYAYETTADARLIVRLKRDDDTLAVDIADNGPGLPAHTERDGFGFRLVESLAVQLHASIEQQESPHGCHWHIKLPLHGHG